MLPFSKGETAETSAVKSHEVLKVFRSLLKSLEVSWSLLKPLEISWSLWSLWSLIKFYEVSWSLMKSNEVSWSLMKSYKVSWSLMKFHEFFWKFWNTFSAWKFIRNQWNCLIFDGLTLAERWTFYCFFSMYWKKI